MSQEQFYQTVQLQEEYEMRLKNFTQELREEFEMSGVQYCLYCLTDRGNKYSCCHENHFGTFNDLPKEDQDYLIQEEIDNYQEWSKK